MLSKNLQWDRRPGPNATLQPISLVASFELLTFVLQSPSPVSFISELTECILFYAVGDVLALGNWGIDPLTLQGPGPRPASCGPSAFPCGPRMH